VLTLESAQMPVSEPVKASTLPTVEQAERRRTGALLRHQKRRGILRSVKDPKHGRFDLWEIAV
jgi:hypothetical protein